jgi:hypothetical protein
MSDTDHVQGSFNTPIPCPDCGTYMATDYDPLGLPAARCPDPDCGVGVMPDDWLRENGYWEAGD